MSGPDRAGVTGGHRGGAPPGGPDSHVVATAGHVDHGKSTLVRALTGIDPDRWEEEKRRGLTIDLGFAWLDLPDGSVISFVDVPGHVRFLRNMIAGVGGVEACLFVVAATEGWKPQSEEHLRILELLGVRRGVVALTKVDLVDDDLVELATGEIAERTAGTFLASAPVVPTAVGDPRTLEGLVAALRSVLATAPPPTDDRRTRLWVDRSFTAHGAGTVVTGTLTGGALAVGDEVVVVRTGTRGPRQITRARVRGLQHHGRDADRLGPGRRAAVNLTGVHHREVHRGDALVHPDRWHLCRSVDATLTVLGSLDHPVTRRGAYAAYIGSGEHMVSVRVLGADRIEPGETGWVRLHLPVAVPLVTGDRFLIRDVGRSETVGGGTVMVVDPRTPAARTRPVEGPDGAVERVVDEAGWITVEDLERRTGRRRPPTVGGWVVSPRAWEAAVEAVRTAVDRAGELGVELVNLDERLRAVATSLDDLVVEGGRVRRPDAADPVADHPWLAALEADPFRPPPPEGVDRAVVREMARRGLIVEADGTWFATSAVTEAARRLGPALTGRPEGLTVAEVRDLLGTTRKWALPLLALLDREGWTRRRGDRRQAGPRLTGARAPDTS